MTTLYPLTVYFDASCALCDSEMQNIKQQDLDDVLILIDCSAADFDDSAFAAQAISRDTLMNCLHVQDANGAWFKGVAAFEVIYRSVGMASIARLWGHPWSRPLAERLYPWVVRHRHLLSALGLHKLFGLWSHRVATAAYRSSQACRQGSCSMPRR